MRHREGEDRLAGARNGVAPPLQRISAHQLHKVTDALNELTYSVIWGGHRPYALCLRTAILRAKCHTSTSRSSVNFFAISTALSSSSAIMASKASKWPFLPTI